MRSLPAFPLIAATLVEPLRAIPPTDRRCGSLGAVPDRVQDTTPRFSRGFRLAGAAVHLYTAAGTVVGLLIVLAAIEGETTTALWLFFVALFIDGTDGMLARRFRVKETIPWFDGALLDNIVDYLTYVFAPIVLLWTTGSLPEGAVGWVVAALPLLASSYQFCRVDAKLVGGTGDDHFFLGFPSYWNVIAFYAIVLDASPTIVAVILVVFCVLVFVPIRYLYPSRMTTLRTTTLVLSTVWAVTYVVLLVQYPDPHPAVVAASLAYLVYYNGLSVWFTVTGARARRRSAERVESSGQV
jgi:phosphatidylcholine synthase